MPAIKPRDVNFLGLRDSILCSECELISYNNTSRCLACGSTAVLSLARVLGGSLHGEQCARIVTCKSQRKVVEFPSVPPQVSATAAGRRAAEVAGSTPAHRAMKLVVERGYGLSRSGGIAVATNHRGRMVCEARLGTLAPPLGAEVRSGISALSLQSRRTLRCDVAADDKRVDTANCRALGISSIVAAPITNLDRAFGLLIVLSPHPYAFNDRDVAVVQWLAGMMAVVFTGTATGLSFARSSTHAELPGSA
jgi:GAF domain